ncbi:tetratricopeptide repeat protein, partial [Parabacteroides bouchesdurhonensis]
ANVNAAAAVLLVGDTKSAHEYLDRFKDDPRAYNNYGVLCFIEGNRAEAEYYFRKALKSDAPKARENLLRLEVQL